MMQPEVIKSQDGSLVVGRARLTATGIEAPHDLTLEEWRSLGVFVMQAAARQRLAPKRVAPLRHIRVSEIMKPRRGGHWRKLQPKIPNTAVYVVRDGGTVMYVGSTVCGVASRLRQHVSVQSPLGAAIADGRARTWDVEMIPGSDRSEVLALESLLISELSPVLNEQR